MKERGEREYRKGVWCKKEKRQGFLGKMPFFLPWLASRTEGEGGRAGGRPAGVPAGAPCSSATSEWREMERRLRGFYSPTYLVLWRHVGVDRRWRTEGGGAGYGRRAPMLRLGKKVAVVVRGSPGSGQPLFISGIRRFGRPIFRARGASVAVKESRCRLERGE
jgi:hypothetical protein